MLRLVVYLLAVTVLAVGLSWLADRPGSVVIEWQGYEIATSVFRAIVILAFLLGLVLVLWAALRQVWDSPAAIGRFFNRRRQKRGLEALSSGMIAIGAGDRTLATRYAIQARKSLPNEPLTHLLRAQAALLSGDRTTSRRIFEAMLGSPDTEQLGLRGLFLEAEREGEVEAARQFAKRAMALNPQLAWPVEALFDIQCKGADWDGALETLAVARRYHHTDRAVADRRRAVLLTAQAQQIEETDPDRAMALALEAHSLAPDLVPAAAIAGRVLAAKGNTARAARVLQRTWKRSPHPDIATAYAYARIGDSPHDRLERARILAALRPHSIESAIAVATAAIEARDWAAARHALQPMVSAGPTQRACTLMARIEAGEHGDKGRVREWLARAVNAPRDPAWTADGIVSERWAPVSPVTGALDAFQWRVPVEALDSPDTALLNRNIDELVKLGARPEIDIDAAAQPAARSEEGPVIDAAPVPAPAEATPRPDDAPEPKTSTRMAASTKTGAVHEDEQPPVFTAPTQQAAAVATAEPQPVAADREAETRRDSSTMTYPRSMRRVTRSGEARLFVPPRAPDDPGPELPDTPDDLQTVGYPAPLKGSA